MISTLSYIVSQFATALEALFLWSLSCLVGDNNFAQIAKGCPNLKSSCCCWFDAQDLLQTKTSSSTSLLAWPSTDLISELQMFVFPVFDFFVHVVQESLCLCLVVLYVFLYRVFPLLNLQPKHEMCKYNILRNMMLSKFVLAIITT